MTTDAKVQIGNSTDFLEGVSVTTPAGSNLFREGVVISDPQNNYRATVSADGGLSVDATGSAITDSKVSGTWGYLAGTSGSVSVPAGGKVLQISATASVSGSFTVNGGASITIPANQQYTLEPRGNLVAPTVVFSGTSSYVIEYVV